MADKRIETHAAGAEERVAVDDPVVEFVNFTAVDNLNRLLQIHRKQQVAGQSVAGTARDDAESRLRMHDGTCHFVYRSVAANGNDDIDTLLHCLTGNLTGVSGILSHP